MEENKQNLLEPPRQIDKREEENGEYQKILNFRKSYLYEKTHSGNFISFFIKVDLSFPRFYFLFKNAIRLVNTDLSSTVKFKFYFQKTR